MTFYENSREKNKLHIFGGGLYVDRAKDIALEHGWNVIIRSSVDLEKVSIQRPVIK